MVGFIFSIIDGLTFLSEAKFQAQIFLFLFILIKIIDYVKKSADNSSEQVCSVKTGKNEAPRSKLRAILSGITVDRG